MDESASARIWRWVSLGALGLLFIGAGMLHFRSTANFVRIVPPWLPAHVLLVDISGVCEILGGIGLLLPGTRRWAGIGLIALLVAVFPANLQMAMHPGLYADLASPLLLWLRLPLQPLLIVWVWAATIRSRRPAHR